MKTRASDKWQNQRSGLCPGRRVGGFFFEGETIFTTINDECLFKRIKKDFSHNQCKSRDQEFFDKTFYFFSSMIAKSIKSSLKTLMMRNSGFLPGFFFLTR